MKQDKHFKNHIKTLLDTAMLASAMRLIPEYADEGLCITFCVTCMRREDQLVTAMMVNVSLWWSLRKYWRLVIMTFAEDFEVQKSCSC